MAMIEFNKDPSRRDLAVFGMLFGLFFAAAGTVALWQFEAPQVAYWVWGVAGTVTVVFWMAPPVRKPLYLGWMYAVLPIGWTVSHLLLALIYFFVVTPIGLVMRVFGYDPLHRRLDRSAKTYWRPRARQTDPKRYFRQF